MSETRQSPRPAVRILSVVDDDDGMRIDNFLLRELRGVPRSRVYRLLRRGEVRVNRGRVRPAHRLRSGDQVRLPPVRMSEAPSHPAGAGRLGLDLESTILFEDQRLIVINKPSGVAVHGGSGVSVGVIEALRSLRPAGRLELVHRLDRDTSGCLMVAKRRSELRALHALLRSNQIEKRYLALLDGRFREQKWICDAPLAIRRRGGERHAVIDVNGKPAQTEFLRLERYRHHTLVEVLLHTGRTHQIRAHAAYLGHPVSGDPRYGAPSEASNSRLFLHAHALRFVRPHDGEDFHVNAPLPADLRDWLARLG